MFHSTVVFSLLALTSASGYYQSSGGSQFSSCILCGDGGDKPSIQSASPSHSGNVNIVSIGIVALVFQLPKIRFYQILNQLESKIVNHCADTQEYRSIRGTNLRFRCWMQRLWIHSTRRRHHTPSCSPAACAYASRIRSITLEFTSNVGRGSFHPSQDSHVLIQELYSYQNSARVVVMSTQSATGVFAGASTNDFRVNVGQQFTLQGARGSGEFGASVLIKVGGKRIRFNTNCNAEVNIGDVFGSVRVVGYENSNGVSCGAGGGYRKARSLRGRQL
eukprot:m.251426 g.251426  ORF g.251426 m.251426 type:complete len:276 (+) comp19538_c0_seq1:1039-1866(+)